MRALTIWLVLSGVARAQAPEPSAGEVVARLQRYYESIKDLQAHFEQSLQSGTGGAKNATGELRLKKPGRMRWQYLKPEQKLMVSDGQTLWVYEPEDEQAFRQDLRSSTLPVSVSFLLGQGKLADEFEISAAHPEGVGHKGEVVLKLVPKAPTAAYRYLLFVVDPKSGLVRETVVYDQQGGSNHLVFSDVKVNQGAADSHFKFTPPAGTRVLTAPGR